MDDGKAPVFASRCSLCIGGIEFLRSAAFALSSAPLDVETARCGVSVLVTGAEAEDCMRPAELESGSSLPT